MTELAARLEGVGKSYPHFALNDVNLDLPTGSVTGFIGANGAGKSTTIRILMGLVHHDRGTVTVLGQPMPAGQAAAKSNLGFVSEDMRLYKAATLAWHMEFVQSVFPSWDQTYAESLMTRFDLKAAHPIKGLSHGQRVKAALLLALARRPKLLILDEPTTGLGVRMALGAQSNQVTWLFLRQSFVQLAIGLTLGVAGAYGVGRLFQSVQTTAGDPLIIGGIAVLLAVVAVGASVWPARRATLLDPLIALRHD